jgi:hypothetical protein
VETINGLNNRSVSGGQLRPPDPEFLRVVQTLRKAQISAHVGIRVERDKDKTDGVVFFFRDKEKIDPELAKELGDVRKTLRLDPDRGEFRIVFGATAKDANEIAILSRPVIRILSELSTFVEVPVEHLASEKAPPIGEQDTSPGAPFRVLSGDKKPCDAFAAVCYEGRWFWIEKSDFQSKRTMGYLLILLALADTGPKENLPVITIQAN